MAFRLPNVITTLCLYNGHIPRIFLDVHVISLLQSWVDYSSDGPRCLRRSSSRRPSSSRTSETCLIPKTGFASSSADQPKAQVSFAHPSLWCLCYPTFAYLRLPGQRAAKAGIIFARPWLQRTCGLVFALLRRPDRRWCPQQVGYNKTSNISQLLMGIKC